MGASVYHVVDMGVTRGVGFRVARMFLVEIIRIVSGFLDIFIYILKRGCVDDP